MLSDDENYGSDCQNCLRIKVCRKRNLDRIKKNGGIENSIVKERLLICRECERYWSMY